MRAGYNRFVPLPRWITAILALVAISLVPWTLWLTFSLPSKHVSRHYDLAWAGFDVALACMFALTAWAGYRRSALLPALAAATAAMLACDAWFDVVTASPGERTEAILQAGFGEVPLAILCVVVAYDAQRAFASVDRLRGRPLAE
jgi:hypothetical protein